MAITRILVVDDKSENRKAAEQQLSKDGVLLTVVETYDEACEILSTYAHGNWKNPVRDPHPFNIVLVDLLMPASGNQMGPNGRDLAGEEMPIGIFLALLAARNGAEKVALFTDSSHHDHPASTCLDAFNLREYKPEPFMLMNGAQVFLTNCRNWVQYLEPENLTREVSHEEIKTGKPFVRAKRWDKLLEYMFKFKP